MAANRQCPYRSQEHECKQPLKKALQECTMCLRGQQVDAIELVASAIMEKSIDMLQRHESHYDE